MSNIYIYIYIHRDAQSIVHQALTVIFDIIGDTVISKIQRTVHSSIMTRLRYNYHCIYSDIKVKYQ